MIYPRTTTDSGMSLSNVRKTFKRRGTITPTRSVQNYAPTVFRDNNYVCFALPRHGLLFLRLFKHRGFKQLFLLTNFSVTHSLPPHPFPKSPFLTSVANARDCQV